MKSVRTLVLKSEALTELTTGELGSVAGGNTRYCVSNTCYSWNAQCLSRQMTLCDVLTGTCA